MSWTLEDQIYFSVESGELRPTNVMRDSGEVKILYRNRGRRRSGCDKGGRDGNRVKAHGGFPWDYSILTTKLNVDRS